MRKIDRIKALETEQAVLRDQVSLLIETLLVLVDLREMEKTNLESGKWYTKPKE